MFFFHLTKTHISSLPGSCPLSNCSDLGSCVYEQEMQTKMRFTMLSLCLLTSFSVRLVFHEPINTSPPRAGSNMEGTRVNLKAFSVNSKVWVLPAVPAAPVSVTQRGRIGVPVDSLMSQLVRPLAKVLSNRSNGRCERSNHALSWFKFTPKTADEHRLSRGYFFCS